MRARVVLLSGEGSSHRSIAQQLRLTERTILSVAPALSARGSERGTASHDRAGCEGGLLDKGPSSLFSAVDADADRSSLLQLLGGRLRLQWLGRARVNQFERNFLTVVSGHNTA